MNPIKIEILDVDEFIQKQNILEVKSTFIKEVGSDQFDKEGLFSEEIFGELASTDRLIRFGKIKLNTTVIHPFIYGTLLSLKRFYDDILSRTSYAIFDKTEKDFIKADENDDNANTGFTFFLKHFNDIQFKETNSLKRKDKIALMNKYKTRDRLLIKNWWLVIPAGIREYKEQFGVTGIEEINKLYMSLINYARSIPPQYAEDPMFDNMRYAIQKKIIDIKDYILNMVDGKKGYLQRKYANRNIALGTRNVISAADMSVTSPDDPTYIKSNETKVPLYQAIKGVQPLVINSLKRTFFSQLLDESTTQVMVIDPRTYDLKYVHISSEQKDLLYTSDGMIKFIDMYKNKSLRMQPVKVYDEKGSFYYIGLIYDLGEDLYFVRNVNELKQDFKTNLEIDFEKEISELGGIVYKKPMTEQEIIDKFNKKILKELMSDPVHKFRIESGIELIHKEATYKNFINTCKNWLVMPDNLKKISDEKSYELFGVSNEENMRIINSELRQDFDFDITKLRPITLIEVLYIAAYNIMNDKHVLITRYPVIAIDSIYPSKVHLMSTLKSRKVRMHSQQNKERVVKYYEYPDINSKTIDSVIVHPSRLKGLGGDYDGDTVSANIIASEEANEENERYLNDLKSIIRPDGTLSIGGNTDLIDLSVYNLLRDPE